MKAVGMSICLLYEVVGVRRRRVRLAEPGRSPQRLLSNRWRQQDLGLVDAVSLQHGSNDRFCEYLVDTRLLVLGPRTTRASKGHEAIRTMVSEVGGGTACPPSRKAIGHKLVSTAVIMHLF